VYKRAQKERKKRKPCGARAARSTACTGWQAAVRMQALCRRFEQFEDKLQAI
jgi:hypothetical protein